MHALRVLVVDDEPLVCEMLRECLAAEGCAVLCAADALGAPPASEIDVAVIDVVIPGELDGLDLAVRYEETGVPVILMSGEAVALDRVRATGRPCLQKPFRVTELLELLQSRASERPHARAPRR
jgi:DNA-binding response OmpR family regulator